MSELLSDPDFVTSFELSISTGRRVRGGEWIESFITETRIGVIQPSSQKDTQYLKEGDKNKLAIRVYSDQSLSASDKNVPKLGDKVKWNNKSYRIASFKDWSQYGYWQALALELDKNEP